MSWPIARTPKRFNHQFKHFLDFPTWLLVVVVNKNNIEQGCRCHKAGLWVYIQIIPKTQDYWNNQYQSG
jgi:hypothetical protein